MSEVLGSEDLVFSLRFATIRAAKWAIRELVTRADLQDWKPLNLESSCAGVREPQAP